MLHARQVRHERASESSNESREMINIPVRLLIAMASLPLASGCDKLWAEVALLRGNEVVMCPGSEIVASANGEQITILANSVLGRTYRLNSRSVDVTVLLSARTERWYGSFGLYRPNGVDGLHLVLDEGFQYFSNEAELEEWIGERRQGAGYIHTSDGLFLSWTYQANTGNRSVGPGRALAVELWQTYVAGSKPKNIPASRDAAFSKRQLTTGCTKNLKPYTASLPATVNGRTYSGRALDFMRERGITAEEIELWIKESEPEESGDRVNYYGSSGFGLLSWVTLDKTGRVVSMG